MKTIGPIVGCMTSELLKVRGLKKHFPVWSGVLRHQVGAVKAVDGIDFTVRRGEVLGLVGESGSGKSTAARAAIRLIEPTAGEVWFEGKDLLAFGKEEMKEVRREIQMVFQDPYASLNPRKAIGDSIGEALLFHGATEQEVEARVVDILRMIGLDPDAMERYPHEFSGGQQQRVCVGRAIALKPKLVVCDEAVSALDVSVQSQILNLLLDLKEELGLSYLFISHDLAVIRQVCDRVLVMHHGKIVEAGETDALYEAPEHPYTKKLLAAIPC